MNSRVMRIASLFLLLFGLLLETSYAKPQDSGFKIDQIYPIDRGHSYIGFLVKYMAFAKVRGRFPDWQLPW